MKLFECGVCGQTLYFENRVCEKCKHRLGYIAGERSLAALVPETEDGSWHVAGAPERRYRFCDNARYDTCNWLVDAGGQDRFCAACRHNALIPDLSVESNVQLWRNMEFAKHRLFYTLMELDLPLTSRIEDPDEGLAFAFLEDTAANQKVLTGHDLGKITINIAEADDAERERRRASMHEPYRTLLGHFRHEIGHWYWDRLVRDQPALGPFREIFGDERDDYNEALKRHYANGAPPDWREHFVSAYATSHPWEDFAETWAHYLHIIDTLETASEFGVNVHPRHIQDAEALSTDIDFEPQHAESIKPLIDAWLPLTFAVNSLNRSMGQSDLYPFVLSPAVVAKLGFVHDLVHRKIGTETPAQPTIEPDTRPPVDDAA